METVDQGGMVPASWFRAGIWWRQLQPTLPDHSCVPQGPWLSVSAHLCSYCSDDLLKSLSVCPSACLSGCTAHLSVHLFTWIWSCPLSSVPRLGSTAQVWPCAHHRLPAGLYLNSGFPAEAPSRLDSLQPFHNPPESHVISDVELISIKRTCVYLGK